MDIGNANLTVDLCLLQDSQLKADDINIISILGPNVKHLELRTLKCLSVYIDDSYAFEITEDRMSLSNAFALLQSEAIEHLRVGNSSLDSGLFPKCHETVSNVLQRN